ncbi:MAG: acyl-[acyl-carrier-protein] thioesterase [Candidatus Aphodosoma sp.]
MDNLTDTFDFFVYPHDAGASKRMQVCNLGAYILDAAGLAAKQRGFGMDDMHAIHRAWVVSRMTMEIEELPREYETISIRTWIDKIGHASSTRHMTITDINGKLVCKASTIWSIIDTDTRHLIDLMETTDLNRHANNTMHLDISTPRRIEIPKDAVLTNCTEHRVAYSDIDMNHHVNSMKYLQWCIDTLPYSWFAENAISRCDINFIHEILPEQNIDIRHYRTAYGNETGMETNTFDIYNKSTQCCRIQLTSKNTQQIHK